MMRGGGSFGDLVWERRAATRGMNLSWARKQGIGFRCVLAVRRQP